MNMQEQGQEQEHADEREPAQQNMPQPGLLAAGSPMREVLIRGTRLRRAADQLLDSAVAAEGDESKLAVSRAAVDDLRHDCLYFLRSGA